MKFVSRRTKRPRFALPQGGLEADSKNASVPRQRSLSAWSEKSQVFWQKLAPRDQLALSILMLFFIILVGGYGGYRIHIAAKASKLEYQNQVADYFWLRSQAANIDPKVSLPENTAPPANQINADLLAMGIQNAQVVATGNEVQISFQHPSQALVASTLSQLEQQGWPISKLIIQQDPISQQLSVQMAVKP